MRYIQKPQDGHADTVAKLSFSPSYVTYNPVTIENVQGFFKTGEVGLCSALSADNCRALQRMLLCLAAPFTVAILHVRPALHGSMLLLLSPLQWLCRPRPT